MERFYTNTADVMLPLKFKAVVEQELCKGERIKWVGQPRAGRLILRTIPIVLFAVPWTAFAVFWIWTASGGDSAKDAPGPFRFFFLFGVPFVLIGVFMLLSPLFAVLKAKGVVYVVTDQRAIIFEKFMGVKVKSYTGKMLSNLGKTVRGDGSGDILFEDAWPGDERHEYHNKRALVGFLGIERVNEVDDMLKTLAHSSERT